MFAIFNAFGNPTKARFTYYADAEFQLKYLPKGFYVDSIETVINKTNKYKLSID